LNAAKVLGPRFGVAVLVVDMLKGALAAVLGRAVAGDNGAYAAGASAVAGHCFLPWRGFRGGKGVATSSGTAFVCFPPYALPDIGVAALAYFASRGPRSLESGPDNHPAAKIGTLVASAAFSLAATYWWRARRPNLWGPRPTLGLPLYAIATSALIAYRFMQADRKRADRMPTAPIESDSPTPAVWTGRRPEVQ
jgi:glycerol-3-phosphate acyltransferase PlsY